MSLWPSKQQAELDAMQQYQAAQQQRNNPIGASHSHGLSSANFPSANFPSANFPGVPVNTERYSSHNLSHILALRMGWVTATLMGTVDASYAPGRPFGTCEVRKLNDSEAVLFVIHNGEPLTFRDELALFPSDTLIAQLKLLCDTTTKP